MELAFCTRCEVRHVRPGGSFLCDQCYGRCVGCGIATLPAKTGGMRTYCGKCLPRRETCSMCGNVRDGSHPSYCRACSNEKNRQWVANNRKRRAKSYRNTTLRNHGLTTETYDALLTFQDGKCAGCDVTAANAVAANQFGQGSLHVDHCHTTGELRGLLCSPCNNVLGLADDSQTVLDALATYLERRAPVAARLPRVPPVDPEKRVGQTWRHRKWVLKTAYGLTPEDHDALLASQDYGCAGCGVGQANGAGRSSVRLHVDHCHDTGIVRGILCHRCNRAIGRIHDDSLTLRCLSLYLEDPPAPRAGVVVTVPR